MRATGLVSLETFLFLYLRKAFSHVLSKVLAYPGWTWEVVLWANCTITGVLQGAGLSGEGPPADVSVGHDIEFSFPLKGLSESCFKWKTAIVTSYYECNSFMSGRPKAQQAACGPRALVCPRLVCTQHGCFPPIPLLLWCSAPAPGEGGGAVSGGGVTQFKGYEKNLFNHNILIASVFFFFF